MTWGAGEWRAPRGGGRGWPEGQVNGVRREVGARDDLRVSEVGRA